MAVAEATSPTSVGEVAIPAEQLAAALKTVAPATKSKGLYANQLRIGAGAVAAFDGDLGIEVTVTGGPAEAVVVPHSALERFVAGLEGEVVFALDDADLVVAGGGARLRLRTRPADDLPTIRHVEGEAVDLDDAAALAGVVYAAATDQARPTLTGVMLGDGWAAATDSYRLAVVAVDVELPEVIIPAGVVKMALKGAEAATLAVDDRRATFTVGDTRWTTRLIEGRAPSWRGLIGEPAGQLAAAADALLDGIARVDVFPRVTEIRLTPDAGGVRLSVRSPEGDEAATVVAGVVSEPVGFRTRFLRDMVAAAAAGGFFHAALDGPSKPMIVGSLESGRADLLMPVRLP